MYDFFFEEVNECAYREGIWWMHLVTHTSRWIHHVTHISRWMHHVTHMNASHDTHECITGHTWIHHVTHMNASRDTHECITWHTWMHHVTHMNASRDTHECITRHTYLVFTWCFLALCIVYCIHQKGTGVVVIWMGHTCVEYLLFISLYVAISLRLSTWNFTLGLSFPGIIANVKRWFGVDTLICRYPYMSILLRLYLEILTFAVEGTKATYGT
jgi:hypothetical protein